MKYEVEFRRTSYITYTVEAASADEAGDLAWDEAQSDFDMDKSDWEIESIEEKK